MFESITSTAVVSAATSWVTDSGLVAPVLVALGLAVMLGLVTYVYRKVASARAGGGRKRR